jgi:chromosomal replication initiation ATPase DnaA
MLDGRFRFDSFVTGPSNRLAVAAARAVAEAPGKVYHPLFLYAEPGLGKTHLLAAIGFHATQVDPMLTAEYRTAEDYVEQLRLASQRGDLNAWRREWEEIGLLLLDDVQLLDGQHEAQAELLRLIDQARGRGFQVVLASDRPPATRWLDQRLPPACQRSRTSRAGVRDALGILALAFGARWTSTMPHWMSWRGPSRERPELLGVNGLASARSNQNAPPA